MRLSQRQGSACSPAFLVPMAIELIYIGLYRFNSLDKKKKWESSSTVCMHACRHLRWLSVSNRSAVALRFFPALFCLHCSWSSLRTLALCFNQSWCSSRQRAKIFFALACFSGSVEALRIVLSMALAVSEHSFWSICKRCSSCMDWTNETEKKIELEKREWVSAGRVTDLVDVGGGGGGGGGRERDSVDKLTAKEVIRRRVEEESREIDVLFVVLKERNFSAGATMRAENKHEC